MHLLQAQAGAIADGSEAVDLGQTPGDIVVLSAADTELANLAAARAVLPDDLGQVRLANLMQLGHNMSVDLYVDTVIRHARLVVVRLLGGAGYWPYGVEQLCLACAESGAALAFLPGDDQPDVELAARSTLPAESGHRLWQYLVQGGPDNAKNFLTYAASLIGRQTDWAEPVPLLRAGLYWPGLAQPALSDLQGIWTDGAPVAAIVFYRAHLQSGNLEPVDALIGALQLRGINPLPLYAASLKDPVCADFAAQALADAGTGLVLNSMGFALSSPGQARAATPFDDLDCPVIQVVLSGGTEAAWDERRFARGRRPDH
jgi:cobaltochelatase CobN